MSYTPKRLGAGPQDTTTTDTALGFKPGELSEYGEYGKADAVLVLQCQTTVTASANTAALSVAQREAYLSKLTCDLRFDGNTDGVKEQSENKDNPLHPYINAKLSDVRIKGFRLIEKDVLGFTDAVEGLATPFVAGANVLKFDVAVSLGEVEFLNDILLVNGVGPDKLSNMSLEVKQTETYFPGVSANLTFTKLQVDFKVLRIEARGSRMGSVPIFRKTEPSSTAYDVKTTRGAILDLVDFNSPLSTSAKKDTKLTIQIGKRVVAKPPETPSTLSRLYLGFNPDVTATMEGAIKDYVTPIFEQADKSVLHLLLGETRVTLEELTEAWKVHSTHLPFMSPAQVLLEARLVAKRRLKGGETLSLVNTAPLMGLAIKSGNAGLNAVLGYTIFYGNDPEASAYPHLRLNRSGEFEVKIPPEYRTKAVSAYLAARRDQSQGMNGDGAAMDAAIHSVALWVPAAVEDEERGLPKRDATGGPDNPVYGAIRRLVEEDAATVDAAENGTRRAA
jgi:hypothetical protein